MREAVDHIGTEIDSLRTLITELRPAALDELGLEPAIESLGQRLRAVEGLEVDVEVEVGGRLDPELETTVYRFVQEALTNVAKHARAEHVRIDVALDTTSCESRSPTTAAGSIPRPRRGLRPGRHARTRRARAR